VELYASALRISHSLQRWCVFKWSCIYWKHTLQ